MNSVRLRPKIEITLGYDDRWFQARKVDSSVEARTSEVRIFLWRQVHNLGDGFITRAFVEVLRV